MMLFCKSELHEKWLTKHGAKFAVVEISHSQINRKVSRENMARLTEPIIEEHVSKLLIGVNNGDVFPALIGYRMDDGMHALIDGNHRDEANLRNGCSPVLMYVVQTDDAAFIELLTRFANRDLNGEGQSREVAIEHAMYLMDKFGYTAADAAVAAGVSKTAVTLEKRVNEIRRFAAKENVDTSSLAKQAIQDISKLNGIDSVFLEALDLAASRKMTGPQVQDMVATINSLPNDEEKRLAELENYKLQHVPPQHKKRSKGKTDKCVLAGNRLDGLLCRLKAHLVKHSTLEHHAITSKSAIVVMRRRIEEVVELLEKLAKPTT